MRWQWVIDDEIVGLMDQCAIDDFIGSSKLTFVEARAGFIAACRSRFKIGSFKEAIDEYTRGNTHHSS